MPRPSHHTFFMFFALFMAIIYLVVASFFLFSPFADKVLGSPTRYFFGGALAVYGCFRAYRIFNQYRDNVP